MWLLSFRAFVLFLLSYVGWSNVPSQPWLGAALGASVALVIMIFQSRVEVEPGSHVVGALLGALAGLAGARLFWGALDGIAIPAEQFAHVCLVVLMGYMGLVLGARKGEWFEPSRIVASFRDTSSLHNYKVLDTSVIIDGRIADICETGFLDGVLVAPQFVLRELQQVADSSDSLKRARGRRGLDILQRIQKMSGVQVQIVELLRRLQAKYGLAYIFVSHDLRVVRALAHEVVVMQNGDVVESGDARAIFETPRTPYTRTLLAAAFDLEPAE